MLVRSACMRSCISQKDFETKIDEIWKDHENPQLKRFESMLI